MLTLTPTLQLQDRPPEPGEYGIEEHLTAAIPHFLLFKRTAEGAEEVGAFGTLLQILKYVKEEQRTREKIRQLESMAHGRRGMISPKKFTSDMIGGY